jgi:cell division protein FtsB
LEFSFDRSNESAQLRNGTQKTQPTSAPEEIDTSTITNERLRKAIEKNRARQAAKAAPVEEAQPQKPRAEERVHVRAPKSEALVTRRSAARPDEAEFIPAKRAPRKVASQISYSTSSRKKSKPIDPTLVGYFVKGCWIFCMVMILRLIFANGGVTDFYSQRSLYSERLRELDQIKKENMQLVREIERMQSDFAFQKKLVRDNLGFIAADEFLVLFPKEKSVQ